MDALVFDRLVRFLGNAPSRRGLLQGLATAALTVSRSPGSGDARSKRRGNKRKHKKKRGNKKPPFNQFGCVDVGRPCRGNSGLCCSGVCQGAKPGPGERDRSRCVAHDTGGCPAGVSVCSGTLIDCTTTSGESGLCQMTTGNASHCSANSACFPCRKDTDCQAVCGAAAACLRCEEVCPDTGGTGCAGINTCAGF